MKSPFRSLFPLIRPIPAVVCLSFAGQAALPAQTNGTWTLDGSGNWSDSANWSGGAVASGATATADLSTLDITGDHVVTLDAPFTIGTLVSQDAVTASHNWNLGGAGPLTLDNGAAQPVLNVINLSLAISAPLDGINGFSKTGSGTLDLSGACTYSGTTTLASGTLKTSGGNNRLPTGSTLAFTGTTGTFDLSTTTQTLAGITVPDGLAASYSINGNGLTLDGTAARQFGPGGTTAKPVTAAHSVAANFSGLSSFTSTAPASVFRVGMKSGAQNSGNLTNVATVTLADQNAITASILAIGDVAANNHGGTSTLWLGRVNTLNVGSINTGASGRSHSNLLFDPGRINPSVTIRNTDGTSAVTDWRVGQVANFNANVWADSVDLSAGTVDALVTTLTVGTADIGTQTGRGGTENASFTMGAGTLEATTLLLGRISSTSAAATITSTMAANGTFTLNHPSGVLKATTLTLAENASLAGGTATRSVSGIFNLTNGTLEATTIQRGAQTGNATTTAAVNWTDGTIRNLTPSGLAINSLSLNLLTGIHVFDATGSAAIAVNAASTVAGTGGITKTGTGTLGLQGTNTYTGPTNVQAGTLAISNSFPGSSTFTVDAAATLELANLTLSGLPALDIDGGLNLTGPVTVGGPLAAIPGNLAGVLQYGSITGAANLQHNYRNASFNVGATATDLTVAAGLPLTWTGVGGSSWDLTTVSWKDDSNNLEKFFWADSVIFDSAGNLFPTVNLAAEMQPAAVMVNEAAVDYVFTGPGFISGTTGLTKDGAAKLTITTNNTNSGTTTINAGTLEVGGGGTTGWMGSGAVVTNASLVFNRSNNITVANPISGTGSLTKLGAGTLTVTADNNFTGGTTISAGALHVGQQTTTGGVGTGDVVNNGQFRLNRADGTNPYAYTFTNNISGTGSLIIGQNVAGSSFDAVVTLTGTNSFAGNITVNSGGLKILNAAALGTGPKTIILTNGSNGRPQFYLDGSGGDITLPADIGFDTSSNDGIRPVIGNLAGDNVIGGNIVLKSGGGDSQIRVLGGTLTLNGQISASTTLRNLRLGGNAGTNGTINGRLTNGTSSWGLFVIGSNTWTLTNGTNDINGNTTVSGGTLLANNAGGSATGTGAISVTAATFGGTGAVSGAVTVNAGGILAPGSNGIESLATGTVNLNDSSTLAIDIHTGSATNDQLVVTGDVNPAGTVNLTLNDLGTDVALPGGTKFVLVDYSGVWDDTDIVHFNGSPVPNGSTISFGANSYVVDYSDDSGSLGGTAMTLTVAGAGNPYTGWADSFSLVGANRAPSADPDHDGLENGIEFIIGANPNTFTPAGDRPSATVTGGNLVFTFRRSDASEAFDVFVEHGTNLAAWPGQMLVPVVDTEGPPVDVADNGPSALDDVTVTIPMGTDTRKFARLRADIPYTP